MVTLAPRLLVPDTLNVLIPEAVSSKSKLPVMVSALVPPARVETKFTVEPVKVRSPVERVTAPVYVCVPLVVTSPPRSVVPETLKVDRPVASSSISKSPVT